MPARSLDEPYPDSRNALRSVATNVLAGAARALGPHRAARRTRWVRYRRARLRP